MARKGQKFNKYDHLLREEILKKYWSGVTSRQLKQEYGVPATTIRMWSFNVRHGRIGRKRGRQKSKNLTLEDYKERYEILKKYQAFLQARRGKK